jgi:hypothetical protein
MRQAVMVLVVILVAGYLAAQDCLILKRMGPADQITSHMYSFGIRGKQFQYVEGQLPLGVKFHGRLTDNDVRKIQAAGAKFVILEPKFTGADLAEARKGCTAAPVPTPVAFPAPAPAVPVTYQQQGEVRVEPATQSSVQLVREEESLGDTARRAKQRKACLELAKDNPSITCQ